MFVIDLESWAYKWGTYIFRVLQTGGQGWSCVKGGDKRVGGADLILYTSTRPKMSLQASHIHIYMNYTASRESPFYRNKSLFKVISLSWYLAHPINFHSEFLFFHHNQMKCLDGIYVNKPHKLPALPLLSRIHIFVYSQEFVNFTAKITRNLPEPW